MPDWDWQNVLQMGPQRYVCGYCAMRVSSERGYFAPRFGRIYICPDCDLPTFFDEAEHRQYPGAPFGHEVPHLPDQVKLAYGEARDCMRVSAYTAAALMCRKILMNVAHHEGATEGLTFVEYIEYLATEGHIPPKSKGWINVIRAKGGEATHEIEPIEQREAEQLLSFTEMLLTIICKYPAEVAEAADGGGAP